MLVCGPIVTRGARVGMGMLQKHQKSRIHNGGGRVDGKASVRRGRGTADGFRGTSRRNRAGEGEGEGEREREREREREILTEIALVA